MFHGCIHESTSAAITNKTTTSNLDTAVQEADCMPTGAEAASRGFCIGDASWDVEAAEATAGVEDREAAAFLTVGPDVEYLT